MDDIRATHKPHDHDPDEPIQIIEIKQPNPGAAFAAQKRAELEMIRVMGGHTVAKQSWKESMGTKPRKRRRISKQEHPNSHVHFFCNFDNSFVNDHGITVSGADIPF